MTVRDHGNTLTDEQVSQIIKRYQNNENVTRIRGRYGITEGQLYRLLNQHNIPMRRPNRTPSAGIDSTEINRLYDRGLSIRAVADELGLSYGAVYRRIPKHKMRPRGGSFNRDPWSKMPGASSSTSRP